MFRNNAYILQKTQKKVNNPYTTWVKVATIANAASPVTVKSCDSFRDVIRKGVWSPYYSLHDLNT